MTSGTAAGPEQPADEAVVAVAAAQARLPELDEQPIAGHVAIYDEVHSVLQGALAGLDRV